MNFHLRGLRVPIGTFFIVLTVSCGSEPPTVSGPSFVDLTWLSMANMHYQIGDIGVVTDGYFTRIPREDFYGGGGGLGRTYAAHQPDVDAVARVLGALGGSTRVDVLLTGHSHFDHSFDTATWSRLTGAPIYGSQTTCFKLHCLLWKSQRVFKPSLATYPATVAHRYLAGRALRLHLVSRCLSCVGITAVMPKEIPSSIIPSSSLHRRFPTQRLEAFAQASLKTFLTEEVAVPTCSEWTDQKAVSVGSIMARQAQLTFICPSWSMRSITAPPSTT